MATAKKKKIQQEMFPRGGGLDSFFLLGEKRTSKLWEKQLPKSMGDSRLLHCPVEGIFGNPLLCRNRWKKKTLKKNPGKCS